MYIYIYSEFFQKKMVIFHSYVSLPEGKTFTTQVIKSALVLCCLASSLEMYCQSLIQLG